MSERDALESQLREAYGRALYTHKTHEKMADRFDTQQRWIKGAQIVLAGLTSAFASVSFFSQNSLTYQVTTFVFSLLTLLLSGYAKDFDPGVMAQKHRETAATIWDIRESYISLLADLKDENIPLSAIREIRDQLQQALLQIYKSAPHTDAKAYAVAQKGLQSLEEMTFGVEEIDKLLPAALRKSNQGE